MDTDYRGKEMIVRNIKHHTDFSRYLFEHPENGVKLSLKFNSCPHYVGT